MSPNELHCIDYLSRTHHFHYLKYGTESQLKGNQGFILEDLKDLKIKK